MQTQKALPLATKPLFVEAEKLFAQMRELTQTTAQRAYEFFEARGREWGNELEDWFRAETELVRRVPIEITETDKQLTLRAEAPGFTAHEIQLSVEPRRVVLSGNRAPLTTLEPAAAQAETTLYNERRSHHFFRALELTTEVDPARAQAALKDGVLEITLPKAATQNPVSIAVQTA